MKAFRVSGEFLMGRTFQPFAQEVAAADEAAAVERVLSVLGSRHRTRRKHIRIREVVVIPPEELENAAVAHQLEGA